MAEEVAGDPFAGEHPGADRRQQVALPVLAEQHVFVRPAFPVGDRFPPRRPGYQFRQFHTNPISARRRRAVERPAPRFGEPGIPRYTVPQGVTDGFE